jgi:hypothetical protein
MNVAWQFIARKMCHSNAVPEGLNERSLAIHCQGCTQNGTRPVGNGMIGLRCHRVVVGENLSRRNRSHRTLRDGFLVGVFLAMNCQATIIESLRDEALRASNHPFARRPS